jgi:hypothetical protein
VSLTKKNPKLFLLLDCLIVKLWSDAESIISTTELIGVATANGQKTTLDV